MSADTKERPILFQGAMVRAILAGTKTQTRRVVKATAGRPIEFLGGGPVGGRDWNDPECWGYEHHDSATWVLLKADKSADTAAYPCPYGWPRDRLWVRETWAYHLHAQASMRDEDGPWVYAADGRPALQMRLCDRWRPSIHMPRAASRITLEITDVRVERLQDISEADALAEGIAPAYGGYGLPAGEHFHATDPRQSYLSLWESINGEGSVEANPWVWAVSFRRAGKES
jgi:hypothetical protein